MRSPGFMLPVEHFDIFPDTNSPLVQRRSNTVCEISLPPYYKFSFSAKYYNLFLA